MIGKTDRGHSLLLSEALVMKWKVESGKMFYGMSQFLETIHCTRTSG